MYYSLCCLIMYEDKKLKRVRRALELYCEMLKWQKNVPERYCNVPKQLMHALKRYCEMLKWQTNVLERYCMVLKLLIYASEECTRKCTDATGARAWMIVETKSRTIICRNVCVDINPKNASSLVACLEICFKGTIRQKSHPKIPLTCGGMAFLEC